MNIRVLLWIINTLCFLLSASALASPKVEILTESNIPYKPIYFSSSNEKVFLKVTGMNECVNVTATLWKLTSRLGAELLSQPLINCNKSGLNFSDSAGEVEFLFTVPKIKRESLFKWEFTICDKQKVCDVIGEFDFSVVSNELLEPVKKWSKRHVLYIYDKQNILPSFFDNHSIEYVETRNLVSRDEQLISMIVVDNEEIEISELIPEREEQAVIVFRTYPTELPIIIDKTNSPAPLIDVSVPILHSLDDAASQKLLLKLFYMFPETKVIN